MSRKNPPAKWTLPAIIDPPGRRCFVIRIPDEEYHIAAFRGALLSLGSGAQWADDVAHTAKDVAAVWRTVIAAMEDCVDINIRLKPTDFCTIQLTTDGGNTWTDVADLSACAHAAAVDEITQAIQDGQLSGGGQQAPGGSGQPGQCYDWDVTLQGSGKWHAPVPVESGDTIQVTLASGATWDGNILNPWRCPDGKTYALGGCFEPTHLAGTDPAPTVPHMSLIGNIPNDATVPYFSMYNLLYTVPMAVVSGEFYLQCNDDVLPDNQGSITLHVQICKHQPPAWPPGPYCTVESAFPQYATLISGVLLAPGYSSAVGLVTADLAPHYRDPLTPDSSSRLSLVRYVFDAPRTVTQFICRYARNSQFGNKSLGASFYDVNGNVILPQHGAFNNPGGTSDLDTPLVWSAPLTFFSGSVAGVKRVDVWCSENDTYGHMHLSDVKICYS